MIALLKARLRDPRTWTVALYVSLLGLTAWIGPKIGLRGEELRMVLSGQGGVGMLLAWILKSPLHKDSAAISKTETADEDADES